MEMSTVIRITDPIARMLGEWSIQLDIGSFLLRMVLSLLMSAIIGCERASKRHAAGLRTFVLVSLAATSAMLLESTIALSQSSYIFILSAAVIIGVASLSANSTLFTSRNQIKGLTTSVGLWSMGILGLIVGAGLYTLALISFVAYLCALSLFPAIERYLKDRSNHFEVHLELKNASNLQDFIATIRGLGIIIDDIEVNPAYVKSGLSVYSVCLSVKSAELKQYKSHKDIISALSSLEYVHYIEEMT